jgi:Na+/proline symporter
MLMVTRAAAVVCGAIVIMLAIVSPSIIGVIGFFYALLGVELFVPILAGMYVRRAGTPEALAAIAAGMAAMLAVQMTAGSAGVFGVTPALAGILASTSACAVVLTVKAGVNEQQRIV